VIPVIIRPGALTDFEEIWLTIALENKLAAERVAKSFKKKIDRLALCSREVDENEAFHDNIEKPSFSSY
jgi:plasmid stabilization system protein ParE